MVSQQKKDVAVGIVDFLSASIQDGTISGDEKESLEVAIDCISEVFGVNATDKGKIYGDESLESLVAKLKVSGAGSSPTATTENTSGPATAAVSAADKAEAEKLKVEGNRAMAQRNFPSAVEAYTKAIELDPTNAIYLSNRSAAYSSLRESSKAAEDARAAIKLDSAYSKAYSRLGLALYSMGDAEGAMKAYEDGLKAEGATPSEGMKKGYETAKKRVQEDLEAATGGSSDASRSVEPTNANSGSSDSNAGSGAGAGAGGMPDLSSMFGGNGGGLGAMLQDPRIQQMASNLMSNPGAFGGMMESMMQDPSIRRMQEQMMGGNMPNLSDMMNNPAIQNLRNQFGGGGNGESNGSNGSTDSSS